MTAFRYFNAFAQLVLRLRRRLAGALCATAMLTQLSVFTVFSQSTASLKTIEQIQNLDPSQVSEAPLAEIAGIVTYFDPEWALMFVHDWTGTVYVYTDFSGETFSPGDRVRITGRVRRAAASNYVQSQEIIIEGNTDLPEADNLQLGRFPDGFKEARWIEVSGTVRLVDNSSSNNRTRLRLYSDGKWIDVWVQESLNPEEWIDKKITVWGNCVIQNETYPEDQTVATLMVAELEPDNASSSSPGPTLPWTSIGEIHNSGPDEFTEEPVTLRGAVTLAWDELLCLQDLSAGILVPLNEELSFQLGEVLEVTGLVRQNGAIWEIDPSIIRIVDSGQPLNFSKTEWNDLEEQTLSGNLAHMEALFMGTWQLDEGKTIMGLLFENQPVLVEIVNHGLDVDPRWIRPGALLGISGVTWSNESDEESDTALKIFLNSPHDIAVIRQGEWWNGERVAFGFILFSVLLGGCSVLIYIMRKKVIIQHERNGLLQQQINLERHYQKLFDTTYDIIFSVSSKGKIASINPSATKASGYSEKELLGHNIREILAPVEHDWYDNENGESLIHDRLKEIREMMLKTKTGKELVLETSWVLYKTPRENGIQIIGRDITGRKKAEREFQQYQEQIEKLTSRLVVSEEEERRRIATELHDLTGQLMAACKFKLSSLRKRLQGNGSEVLVDEAINLLNESIRSSRSLVLEISPPVLYELGLREALQWLFDRWQKDNEILVNFEVIGVERPIKFEVRSLLFRITQELLLNIVKHANAKHVEANLLWNEESLQLVITDDGTGFDPTNTVPSSDNGSGYGLFSVRDTLRFLGGNIQIDSQINSGTKITISAPTDPVTKTECQP